jgi:uncharacterized membrane protein
VSSARSAWSDAPGALLPLFDRSPSPPVDSRATSGGAQAARTTAPGGPPERLLAISLAVAGGFWGLAALRHALLQSNSFDLGLFDQWVWLISRGLTPVSSQSADLHLLTDHGAWLLFGLAPLYALLPTLQWLLALQSLSLAFTAVPLWILARDAGLPQGLRWTVCGLWWLQPVVFNTNLFDFHPEVLAMPLLAALVIAARRQWIGAWAGLILLILGCRDGLALVTLGLGLEQGMRRRWRLAIVGLGLSLGWLALLGGWLYPLLTARYPGVNAGASRYSYLGDSFGAIALGLIQHPQRILGNVDWAGAGIYLLLLSLPLLPFWRRASLPVLLAGLPLIAVNILSESGAQRSLVHHYSLPLAVIGVVAALDGLASEGERRVPWRRIAWAAACWAALAKPWFFTGPYLGRLALVPESRSALERVKPSDGVATTSYLAPHLSGRRVVLFPAAADSDLETLEQRRGINLLLLNPQEPGWASDGALQRSLLEQARRRGWSCRIWPQGLQLCRRQD